MYRYRHRQNNHSASGQHGQPPMAAAKLGGTQYKARISSKFRPTTSLCCGARCAATLAFRSRCVSTTAFGKRRHLGQIQPKLACVGRLILNQIWSISAELGPTLVEVGQTWLKFGRCMPNSAKFGPNTSQIQANVAQIRQGPDHVRPILTQIRRDFGEFARYRPNSEENAAVFEEVHGLPSETLLDHCSACNTPPPQSSMRKSCQWSAEIAHGQCPLDNGCARTGVASARSSVLYTSGPTIYIDPATRPSRFASNSCT